MTTETRPSFRVTPQVVLGVCIVAFGIALTADNLGLADASRILSYWPLALVLAGGAKLLQSRTTSGRLFGGVVAFIGVALLGDFFDVFDLWGWWPVALVALGVMLIVRAVGAPARRTRGMGAPVSQAATGATGDSSLSEFAFWSGVQRRVASPSFRHADLTAIMGGIELDLRQASTAGGEAVIDVFAMWGGIEITVPPDWVVANEIVPIMGGAEDKSTGTQASQNRLVLRGFAIMGGVEVKT
jgi:predicted membrane protein